MGGEGNGWRVGLAEASDDDGEEVAAGEAVGGSGWPAGDRGGASEGFGVGMVDLVGASDAVGAVVGLGSPLLVGVCVGCSEGVRGLSSG